MDDLRKTLSANVRALLEREGQFKSNETGITRLVGLGVAQGTAQRIIEAKTSVGLDMVQQVAEKLKVKPWQLLVPGLDPRQPQELTADRTAWPLPMVDRNSFYHLSDVDRVFAQGAFQQAINDRPRSPEHTTIKGTSRTTPKAIRAAIQAAEDAKAVIKAARTQSRRVRKDAKATSQPSGPSRKPHPNRS